MRLAAPRPAEQDRAASPRFFTAAELANVLADPARKHAAATLRSVDKALAATQDANLRKALLKGLMAVAGVAWGA